MIAVTTFICGAITTLFALVGLLSKEPEARVTGMILFLIGIWNLYLGFTL